MEGISITMEQGKQIYRIDFKNSGGSNEDTVNLINAAGNEFVKNPLNSVYAIMDLTHAFFHLEVLKSFRAFQVKVAPYQKKVAIIGLKGLQKTGFNSVNASSNGTVKTFDSESEAKGWLLRD
jgi:hypothetical protein